MPPPRPAKLFDGFLDVANRCGVCGLGLGGENSRDGPAVLVILIVGFAVVGLALAVEMSSAPPIWRLMVVWLPSSLVLSVALLRSFKGVPIARQYRHGIEFERGRDPS